MDGGGYGAGSGGDGGDHHQQQQQQQPRSPLDLKPDATALMRGMNGTAAGSPGSPENYGGRSGTPPGGYPPNHPLSGSKHFCTICGDRASGKHYGVYSCEGCKGFFKRTVRKELTYACRENRNCIIDKRQRNRCQYCRYMKCLQTGMRREAVQEERSRGPGGKEGGGQQGKETAVKDEPESTCNTSDMPIDRIIEAQTKSELAGENNPVRAEFQNAENKESIFSQIVEFAKNLPLFGDLNLDDQITLIKSGWNELMILGSAYRSLSLREEGIMMGQGKVVSREDAHRAGLGEIFDRVLVELVGKMKEMKMEKCELACLRAIVLFNPDAPGLNSDICNTVEGLREKVYATLEEHCRTRYVKETSRFAKLLLRLPALRSIGLKCAEHQFFFKLVHDNRTVVTPMETFIKSCLEE